MLACYVSGKGMYASKATWEFKTRVIKFLETSGLGYDTRFRYYQREFPDLGLDELARLICDPIEYYDKGWPSYWANKKTEADKDTVLTEYMLQLDNRFRREARVNIVCFDEAGLGTGINAMRFIHEGKPVLGFYNPAIKKTGVNINNIIQLKIEYPELVTIEQYHETDDINRYLQQHLPGLTSGEA
jgi:hypothetical protein